MILEYEVMVYSKDDEFVSSSQTKLYGFVSKGSMIPYGALSVREVFRIEHDETSTTLYIRSEDD